MDIESILNVAIKHGASDIYITEGRSPSLKVNGKVVTIKTELLSHIDTKALVSSTMDELQHAEFEQRKELNYAIQLAEIGRFRVSALYQRNKVAMVLRRIEDTIPEIDELHIPQIIKQLAMTQRGLVLVVGSTGSGKSTTLAAMIGHRNQKSHEHILTIEDPIEFDHQHINCVVSQREVGVDTESYEMALKNALRQAPDVIMIGEIRTQETMNHGITFSETGHLCLSTLHANNANQALERIINFFPEERHPQLFLDLSLNLKAVIAQRLIPKKSGKGRIAATEILINTPHVGSLVSQGKVNEIKEVMKKSREAGMQTFDQAIYDLYQAGEISYDEALKHADSENELRLMVKLSTGSGSPTGSDHQTKMESLSIQP